MKSLKEIEKMSLEELMEVSSDESVRLPEGFMERIDDVLEHARKIEALTEDDAAGRLKIEKGGLFRRRIVGFVSAAAAVALMIGLGFSLVENEPKDTFDDPQLAYAELEKAFAKISDSVSRGVAMADSSKEIIQKTSEIFE